MIDVTSMRAALARMHAGIGPIRDALNAADRELGDGDTGMTVEQLVDVWQSAADSLPDDVGEALRRLAQETRRASGSSLASVAAIALAAAGKAITGKSSVDSADLRGALAAAAEAITARSGAAPGDKTVLDSLVRIAAELEGSASDAIGVAIKGAETALNELRDRECRVGRSRMYGARTVGRDDPGMLAALLLLRAMREDS